MNGIIYLIINLKHLKENIKPLFYIGSTHKIEKFDQYFGSSKYLNEDIKKYGLDSFQKIILLNKKINSITELQELENNFQRDYNAVKSKLFYNQSYSIGPWHCLDGTGSKNTIWINDGKKNKRINENNIHLYPNWSKGRTNPNYMKNRIYINNGKITKAINSDELHLYSNWNKGKLKGNQQNKIWINKNGKRKMIYPKNISNYSDWNVGWS